MKNIVEPTLTGVKYHFYFQIFFNIIMGIIAIGSAMPSFEYFTGAVASAKSIFETIERVSDEFVHSFLLNITRKGNVE